VLQLALSEVQPRNGTVVLQAGALHVRVVQSEPVRQATSHAQDRPQLTLLHDGAPEQSTLHGPEPHVVTPWQLCAPLHVIVHDLLPAQLMPLRHDRVPAHMMLQFQPAGHVTCCWQLLVSAQAITQLFAVLSHDVHCAGQAPGCASVFPPAST